MQFLEEEMHMASKWKIFSTSYQKMQKTTQEDNKLVEVFTGHHIAHDDSNL